MDLFDLAHYGEGCWNTFRWRGLILLVAILVAIPVGQRFGWALGGALVGLTLLGLLLEMGLNKRMD